MLLKLCRECHQEVSDEVRKCPYCGAPRPAIQGWKGTGIDWRSKKTLFGYPLIHVAFGRNAKGRLRVAKGVIAIGQFAVGLITIAQFGIGVLFGFGQFILGLTGIAQFAITGLFGLGQLAVGYIAIGQFAFGYYVLAQMGFGEYVFSVKRKDPEVFEYLKFLAETIRSIFFK